MQLTLPKILKKIRLDRELSQENIAEELKIDTTTYGRYEKDNTTSRIKFEQVVHLAKFYDLTLDQLYHYGDPEYREVANGPNQMYQKVPKVFVTVELDGIDGTLKKVFKKLTVLNKALSENGG